MTLCLSSRILLALGTLCVVAASSVDAFAWGFNEHKQLTHDGRAAVCQGLSEQHPGSARDTERWLRVALCDVPATQLDSELRWLKDPHCEFGFDELVALVDVQSDPFAMSQKSCAELRTAMGKLEDNAWEALRADEHFCPRAPQAYQSSHELALALASQARSELASAIATRVGGSAGEVSETASEEHALNRFRQALYIEIHALHLLEDLFAAGHAMSSLEDGIDPRLTTSVHDRYNLSGTQFRNARGDSWFGYGDRKLDESKETELRIVEAVRVSLTELATALRVGRLPAQPAVMQDLPICPVNRDIRDETYRFTGGLRASMPMQAYEGNAVVRPTRFWELSPYYEYGPLHSLSLEAGAAVAFYSATGHGVTEAGYEQGRVNGWAMRSVVPRLAVGWTSRSFLRIARLNVNASAYGLGWVATHDPVGRRRPMEFRVYDGSDVTGSLELLAWVAAIRLGASVGSRTSAIQGGRAWTWSPVLDVLYRW